MRSIDVRVLIAIFISIASSGLAANILILSPSYAKSVYTFHEAIAKSLHSAGHQITFVHPFPKNAASKNYTYIDCSNPDQPKESNYIGIDEALKATDIFAILLWTLDESENDCSNTIQLKEIQQILHSKEEKFDVMILDLMQTLYECYLPIAESLKIPVIGTSAAKSWWRTDWLIGNPNNPAIIPTELSFWSPKMNFRQRLTNLWYWTVSYGFENWFVYPKLEAFYKQHFPHSSVTERMKPSLMFAFSHQIFIPRALVPSVINLGGIHVQQQPPKPLPQHFQQFIDEAKNGVILFTLGSLIKMFDRNSTELEIFKAAFAQIPQRVIWKMEEEVEDLPKNVMTSKWLPQRDILAHKNVVAFITHCGLSGIFEALYEAKPLIMMPIFFDQISNAVILEELGVGVPLDVKSLSVDRVLKALKDIRDTKYQEQMHILSKIVKDAPMTQEEEVVYWTEYVIRHKGAPHLRTVAADMPLYQYLLLDIISLVFGILAVFLYLLLWACKKLFKRSPIKKENVKNTKKTK